ncbi:hypothetical protein Tco_0621984 [Tanacetum coccineum]
MIPLRMLEALSNLTLLLVVSWDMILVPLVEHLKLRAQQSCDPALSRHKVPQMVLALNTGMVYCYCKKILPLDDMPYSCLIEYPKPLLMISKKSGVKCLV